MRDAMLLLCKTIHNHSLSEQSSFSFIGRYIAKRLVVVESMSDPKPNGLILGKFRKTSKV
jgi:hypothetical protein